MPPKASLPAPGSVSPQAPIFSKRNTGSANRSITSAEPCERIAMPHPRVASSAIPNPGRLARSPSGVRSSASDRRPSRTPRLRLPRSLAPRPRRANGRSASAPCLQAARPTPDHPPGAGSGRRGAALPLRGPAPPAPNDFAPAPHRRLDDALRSHPAQTSAQSTASAKGLATAPAFASVVVALPSASQRQRARLEPERRREQDGGKKQPPAAHGQETTRRPLPSSGDRPDRTSRRRRSRSRSDR